MREMGSASPDGAIALPSNSTNLIGETAERGGFSGRSGGIRRSLACITSIVVSQSVNVQRNPFAVGMTHALHGEVIVPDLPYYVILYPRSRTLT